MSPFNLLLKNRPSHSHSQLYNYWLELFTLHGNELRLIYKQNHTCNEWYVRLKQMGKLHALTFKLIIGTKQSFPLVRQIWMKILIPKILTPQFSVFGRAFPGKNDSFCDVSQGWRTLVGGSWTARPCWTFPNHWDSAWDWDGVFLLLTTLFNWDHRHFYWVQVLRLRGPLKKPWFCVAAWNSLSHWP